MIEQQKVSPLPSPPTSPRMSGLPPRQSDASWQDYSHQVPQNVSLPSRSSRVSLPPIADEGSGAQHSATESRPQLRRAHKSFPYAATTAPLHQQSPLSRTTNPSGHGEIKTLANPKITGPIANDPFAIKQSESSSPSPNTGLTPRSVDIDLEESNEEIDDDAGMGMSDDVDEEEMDVEGDSGKTAAEKRAEKRKMKRFRLTHNQTRFLMSEFTRQAHPDAAHRERLSREIPGLSPRQVQVWFQNRRAKLKRLTSDDRERMIQSRALPEDFDMSHTLHSTYQGHPIGTPMASPVSFVPYGEGTIIRPLMSETMRRQSEDETATSQTLASSYGNFFTPPGSANASDNMSPVSANSDRAQFGGVSHSQNTSPRSSNPFVRSSSFSTTYHPNPHIPRLHLHDRMGRNRAESLGSPLRSSMSYTGNVPDYGQSPLGAVANPDYEVAQDHISMQPPPESPAHPYGLGHQNTQLQSFQSSALARGRPIPNHFPPGLNIRPDYRPVHGLPQAQNQPSNYNTLQSAPLPVPQEYHMQPQQTPYLPSSYAGPYSSDNASQNSSSMSLPLHLSRTEGGSGQQGEVSSGPTDLQQAFGSGMNDQYQSRYEYGGPQL